MLSWKLIAKGEGQHSTSKTSFICLGTPLKTIHSKSMRSLRQGATYPYKEVLGGGLSIMLAEKGQPEEANPVIAAEAWLDLTTRLQSLTPIHQVCTFGITIVCGVLFNAGASSTARDNRNRKFLLLAAAEGHGAIIGYLSRRRTIGGGLSQTPSASNTQIIFRIKCSSRGLRKWTRGFTCVAPCHRCTTRCDIRCF